MKAHNFLKFFVIGLILSSLFVSSFACQDHDHVEPTDEEKAGTDTVDHDHKEEPQEVVPVEGEYPPLEEEAGLAFGKKRIGCTDEITCAIQQIEGKLTNRIDTEFFRYRGNSQCSQQILPFH